MADADPNAKAPPVPTATPAEQERPASVPAELWSVMSEEQRADVIGPREAVASTVAILNQTPHHRTAIRDLETKTLIAAAQGRGPYVEFAEAANQKLDREREDAKALHAAQKAEFDMAMWRVVFEHAQQQRATDRQEAGALREADRRAQDRHNLVHYIMSLAAILLAALAALINYLRK